MKSKMLKPLTVVLSNENVKQLIDILSISRPRAKEGHQLMTVCADPQLKRMRFLTSDHSQTSQVDIEIANWTWSVPMQFAIVADFVETILKTPSPQALTLLFTPQGDGLIEISFPHLDQYRHTYSQPPVKAHLQSQEWQSSVSPTMHDVSQFALLAEQLSPQCPFDIVKLNPGCDKITVLRSGVISEVHSPLAETLNCDAAVTEQALTSIRKITQSNTQKMGLMQVGDKLLIKTDTSSHAYQIANIDSFQAAINTTQTVVAFITDGIAFKQEIKAYQKIVEVKKNQRSFLLVHDNRLMISATTDNHKMADLPAVLEMKPSNVSTLYSLQLNDINAVKLQGVIDDRNIVLRIELFSDGSHQLVFYNNQKPYAFIPLLPEPEKQPEMIALYCDYLKQISDEPQSEGQVDLFGYDDLLDI
ncbi:hypothetical protein [uncultured Ferrimonas sp.]|uniref:hypothetical protein n=1 Tax=uncultured Ferrimonas sp. TaxID=432640 RepID=UPI00263247EB|nr:hypothetical protein [uncultured Ferrimonas sp.]